MQDPDHQLAKCGKCKAPRHSPCRGGDGRVLEHVHHGRPYWSEIAGRRPFKFQGANGQELLCDHLIEFTVLTQLMPGTPLDPDDKRKVLFEGTDICADCGERYGEPALHKRCEKNHDLKRPKRRLVKR
jgi:hypothetical protein